METTKNSHLQFVKNTGQFHPHIAYVAKVEPGDERYHGSGIVEIFRDGVEFTSYSYVEFAGSLGSDNYTFDGHEFTEEQTGSPAYLESVFAGRHFAMASCHEICTDHGSATAAMLNIIELQIETGMRPRKANDS